MNVEDRLTMRKDIGRGVVELEIVLRQLVDASLERVMEEHIGRVLGLRLPACCDLFK